MDSNFSYTNINSIEEYKAALEHQRSYDDLLHSSNPEELTTYLEAREAELQRYAAQYNNTLPKWKQLSDKACGILTFGWVHPFALAPGSLPPKERLTKIVHAHARAVTTMETASRTQQATVDTFQASPERAKVKTMKKAWSDHAVEEEKRLTSDKKITVAISVAVSSAGREWYDESDRTKENRELAISVGRAQEIRALYQETHNVFYHGVMATWSAVHVLFKTLHKLDHPEQPVHLFKVTRYPSSQQPAVTGASPADILKKASAGRISSWSYALLDHIYSKELLSTSISPLDKAEAESALYFAARQGNISLPTRVIEALVRECGASKHRIVKKLNVLLKEIGNAQQIGNLYAVCVPKSAEAYHGYLSHPFGFTCKCHPIGEETNTLAKLQAGMDDPSVYCRHGEKEFPQYRLFTERLQHEKGVRIFCLSPLPKEQRKQFRARLEELAKEIYAARFVETLPEGEKPEATPLDKIKANLMTASGVRGAVRDFFAHALTTAPIAVVELAAIHFALFVGQQAASGLGQPLPVDDRATLVAWTALKVALPAGRFLMNLTGRITQATRNAFST